MTMVSANWAEAITPETSAAFFMGHFDGGRRTSMIPRLYNMTSSQRAFEKHLAMGAFGSAGWNQFESSGRVNYDDRNKGYETTYTHKEFAKGFTVQRKLVDDNLLDTVFNDARQLGDSAFRFREKMAAALFINAFTDTGTDEFGFAIAQADGVGILSAAHPNSPSDTGTTQSNEGTLALSAANIGSTRQLHMALNDDRGDLLSVMPDEIMVPPELEDTLREEIGSTLDPASANNTINPQSGRYSGIVWHYLTDANSWFMMDSAMRGQDLLWFDRIPLEFGQEDDFDTLIAKFRAYSRSSRGARDWRWIYGQNPS